MKFFYRRYVFSALFIAIIFISCKRNASEAGNEGSVDSIDVPAESDALLSEDTFAYTVNDTADFIFRFHPAVGKTYSIYNSSVSTITNTAPNGEKQTMKTEESVNLSMKIKEKNADGNFLIEMIQKNARQMMQVGDEKQEYISGKAMSDPQADIDRKVLDCMLNVPITLTMNDNAEIENAEGLETIKNKISKVFGDSIPADQIPVPDPSETVENLFLTFPDSAVNKGSAWQKTLPSAVQGIPILIHNSYIITDRDSGVVYIKFTSKISLNRNEIPEAYREQMKSLKLSGTVNGTMEVEEKSGWTRDATASQYILISQEYQGQIVSTQVNGTVKVKSD